MDTEFLIATYTNMQGIHNAQHLTTLINYSWIRYNFEQDQFIPSNNLIRKMNLHKATTRN